VGLELALVGEEAEAKAGQGARLERLGLLEGEVVVVVVDHRGGGGDDRRMGGALERPGRGGTVADLEHCGPGRAAEFRAPTKRSLDVPRIDGRAPGQERRRPG